MGWGGGEEGLRPLCVYCDNSYAVGIRPLAHLGVVWGHAPFGNLDSPRAFLRHSNSHFGSNFYLSTDK